MVLFSLSIAVIGWCFYLMMFLPQQQEQAVLAAKCNVERQRIQVIETYLLAHPNAEEYATELTTNQEYLGRTLPNNGEIRTFLLQLEQSAQESNVQLAHVKPAPPVSKNGYSELPLDITIKGDFFQTLNYLKRLENGARLATISKLSITVQNNVLESKMIVTIYSYSAASPQNSKHS